ncbi:MAG: hypothetical protein IJ604_01280 [Prevotella sp.]|nr:hypothetical protein [Prevotella sp.]
MNKEANRTNKSITLDSDLISFLKTQDNHKFSRYDAFVWLIERICEAKNGKRDDIPSSPRQEYLVKYTDLAKTWRWSRPTVQKFIEGLKACLSSSRKNTSTLLPCLFQRMTHLQSSNAVPATTLPSTITVLAPAIQDSPSVSLLHRTEGSENRIEGRNALKTLSLISVNLH